MIRSLLAVSVMLAGSGPILAQSVNGPGDDVLCSGYPPIHLISASDTRNPSAPRLFQPPPIGAMAGKPVSYRHVAQSMQVLADGTQICAVPTVSVYYRDSAGRTREEQGFGLEGPDGKAAPMIVKILDPVAQIAYTLDIFSRTAYRLVPLKREDIKTGVPSAPPLPNLAIVSKTVSLGKHAFGGVSVEGQLTTTTGTPPRSTVAITITDESWTSPDLEMTVLRKTANPGNDTTTAFLHISTAEPDPALFRVPDGWKIVDGVPATSLSAGSANHTAAGYQYTRTFTPPGHADFVVHEAPYSAIRTGSSTSNLAGSSERPPTISPPAKLYRDRSGRTRTDMAILTAWPGDTMSPPVFPEIDDPVDEVQIILDPTAKIAHRLALRPSTNPPAHVADASGSHPRTSIATSKDLSPSTIEGIRVEGTLETWRTPAGANGNDHELIETTESWYSPDLRLIVRAKIHTVTQDSTMELTNISTGEPDPSLFEIPAGYKVTDEKGPFTISVTHP